MFTGLVAERGRVIDDPAPSGRGGVRLAIAHSAALGAKLETGASLAVAGVCLTVVEGDPERSAVELAPETLAKTTLGALRRGAAVNLEPPLSLGEPLGGHWVQGHVDGTLSVLDRRDLTDHRVLAFELPAALAPNLVAKGSVAIDGVSLTVARLSDDRFEVALIPHTLAVTTLADLVPGDRVNFEADVLGKYVLRAMELYGGGGRGRTEAEPELGEG
jgi:riboflavin synthase